MENEHRINLRLPMKEFEEIDLFRSLEPGKISRNIWIAIAIREKLDRDMKKHSVEMERKRA